MAPAAWLGVAEFAAAAGLLAIGMTTAWSAANAAKRVAGVQIALLGGLLGAAALAAPAELMLATIAIAMVHLALGLAIVVRLQEEYGGGDAPDIDAADEQSDPVERSL